MAFTWFRKMFTRVKSAFTRSSGRTPVIVDNQFVRGGVQKAQQKIDPAPKVDKRYNTNVDAWAAQGKWVRVKSSWVYAMKFDYANKRLFVQFKKGKLNAPGVVCRYDNTQTRTAKDMFRAASMGKFVHRHLYHRPYTIVSDVGF